jgi:hypothetical protein
MQIQTYVIAQLDKTSSATEGWMSYAPGIWVRKMSMTPAEQSASIINSWGGTFDTGLSDVPVNIGSVIVGQEAYNPVSSVDDLYLQNKSFYFDSSSQLLYIAFENYNPYYLYSVINAGQTFGFINKAQKDSMGFFLDSDYGGIHYEARLKRLPSVKQIIDPQKFGVFRNDPMNIQIENGDGKYDNIDETVTGNGMRILIAYAEEGETVDIDDFFLARYGFIDVVNNPDSNTISVLGSDPRAEWDTNVNPETFNLTDYPNINSKLVGKQVPLVIGEWEGIPGYQIDTEDFLVSSETYGDVLSIDKVYVFNGVINGVDVNRELTGGEFSTSGGIITIPDYESGDVVADMTGVNITNIVEIIIFLIVTFQNIAYISSNWNLTEVNEVIAEDFAGHIYFGTKGTTVQSAVEKLLKSINARLLPLSGVLTIRRSNAARTPLYEVRNEDLEKMPSISRDRVDTIKAISLDYNQNIYEDEFITFFDDSQIETAIANNRRSTQAFIETELTDADDAEQIAGEYYDRFIAVPEFLTMPYLKKIDFFISDFLTFELLRKKNEYDFTDSTIVLDRADYEVISVDWINRTFGLLFFADNPRPTDAGVPDLLSSGILSTSVLGGD